MHHSSPLPGPKYLQNLTPKCKILYRMCIGLKLQVKGGLNSLSFSIEFQMLKI